MAKHDALSDDLASTSDQGQPVVTYVRVGRGMVKVTKYEKQDKATRQTDRDVGSIHSFDSSQPNATRAPSVKSRASSGSHNRTMPAWVPKFKKSKKGKKAALDALNAIAPQETIRLRGASSPAPNSVNDHASSVDHSRGQASYDQSSSFPEKPRDTLAPPSQHHAGMPTPPSSPAPNYARPLRAAHSHNDLAAASTPGDMWASIAQLESELVARYGRGAVPQFDALRERVQQMPPQPQMPLQPQERLRQRPQHVEWADDTRRAPMAEAGPSRRTEDHAFPPRVRTRTETLPGRSRAPSNPTRAFVDDLDVYPSRLPRDEPPQTEEPAEDDSDDGAAYLQALGLEPPKEAAQPKKPKTRAPEPTYDSQIRHPQPARSTTLPAGYPQDDLLQMRHDALVASIVSPSPEVLEQYAARRNLPRSDYITTRRVPSTEALGLIVDPASSRSVSPLPVQSPPAADAPESPVSGRRPSLPRILPPRPPPPSTSAPYAPVPPLNIPRAQASAQNSPSSIRTPPLPRPQQSPMSLTVPSPHTPRSASSSQLALPLVRVRITSPPHRGALRALPALILLSLGARAAFAAATWAQMVTYCARNAGVAIARRGGGGSLRVCVEERMAELTSPGGGRGVGDEEVGFGLGYYVSVEMALDDEEMHANEGSVPVANMTIPLPTTLGEVATVFRERKDIRRALS